MNHRFFFFKENEEDNENKTKSSTTAATKKKKKEIYVSIYFRMYESINNHQNTSNSSEASECENRLYTCNDCGKSFQTSSGLKQFHIFINIFFYLYFRFFIRLSFIKCFIKITIFNTYKYCWKITGKQNVETLISCLASSHNYPQEYVKICGSWLTLHG